MMMVLITTDTIGGVWHFTTALTDRLRDIHFVWSLLGRNSVLVRLRQLQAANVDLTMITAKLEWMEHPWQDVDKVGLMLQKGSGG